MQQPMTPEQVAAKIKEQSNVQPKGGRAKSKAKRPQEDLNQYNQVSYDR